MISTPDSVASEAVATPPRRWAWWLLAAGLLLLLGVGGALTFLLDPWLRRTLEKQVAERSHGRYQLQIAELHTSLWEQRLHLRGLRLRTRAAGPDSSSRLPRLTLLLRRLDLTDVGLLALVRRQEVPVGSVKLDSLTLHLAALPQSSDSRPLHQRLPLPGLRIGQVALRQVRASFGPRARPLLRLGPSGAQLQDVWISAAGAADSARIAYAAAVAAQVGGVRARLPGHEVQLVGANFASTTRRLRLDSVVVQPEQAISPVRSAAARVQLTMPQILLTGLDAARLTHRRFRADTLRLTSPRLAFTLPSQPPPSLHTLLAGFMDECTLGHLVLTAGQLRVAGLALAPVVADVQALATDVQVLPHRPAAATVYYARRWQVRTGTGALHLNEPYYHGSWRGVEADTKAGSLQVRRLLVVPTMSVTELARRKGHQAAHVTARLGSLRLTGLNYPAAANRQELRATALTVSQVQVSTRSDGRFGRNPQLSIATPEALGKVPFRFELERLRLQKVDITMSYRSPRDPRPGMLSINRFSGTLRNLTNDPRRMSAATPLTGEAVGWIQNRCRARVTLRANLLDARGRHRLSGTLGPTPLSILHPMLVPTRGLRFRSGQVQRISFQMRLDQAGARGTLWGRYSDLKLQLLNQQEKPGLLPRIGSSLVNGIFIRDNNPRQPGEPLQPGQMTSSRERRYSVFTLWRQGLVSGMLNSAGVPAKLSKKLSESE